MINVAMLSKWHVHAADYAKHVTPSGDARMDGILHGSPIPFGTERGEALTELLENAYLSHREQKIVTIVWINPLPLEPEHGKKAGTWHD